ncbi:MAG: YncE family protein, partial [Polyangiaceae bacterium]
MVKRTILPRTFLFYPIFLALAAAGCDSCKRTTPVVKAAPVPIALGRAAYVTDNGSDQISVIDRDSPTVVARSVDIDPDAHEAPHHLAIDHRTKKLFVALAFPPPPDAEAKGPHSGHGNATNPGKLARLDLETLTVEATVEVDENPGDIALTHDGSKVLVTHFDMKRAMTAAAAGKPPNEMFSTIQIWDAVKMTKLGERALCVAPHGIAVTRDDKSAIVACYGSDEIAIVDLTAPGLPTSRIVLGEKTGVLGAPRFGPYAVALSPSGAKVLIDDLEGQDVRVLDLASTKLGGSVALGARAMISIFVDETSAIVPLQAPDGLARVDIEAETVTAQIAFTKDQ